MAYEDATAYAKKYLEDLLAFFGINIEVDASVEDDVINLAVPSTTMNGFLIGERGANLRSIQHLIGLALSNQDFDTHRVSVDIADYKKQRAERLAEQVQGWAETVKTSGEPMQLSPMNAVDRRTVHKTVSEIEGLETDSEGEGRERHVVIRPKA